MRLATVGRIERGAWSCVGLRRKQKKRNTFNFLGIFPFPFNFFLFLLSKSIIGFDSFSPKQKKMILPIRFFQIPPSQKTLRFSGLFLLIVLFLYGLQPAGIYNMASPNKKLVLIILLSVNFAFVHTLWPRVSKSSFFKKENRYHWVIPSVLTMITSLFILYVRHPYMTRKFFFTYFCTVSMITILFEIVSFLIAKGGEDSGEKSTAATLSTELKFSDSKTSVFIPEKDILWIKSDGNYIEIFENNRKHLLRSSLKKVFEQNEVSHLIRCHKSYIVNKNHIRSITGNSKGYKLKLEGTAVTIPASPIAGSAIKKALARTTG